MINTKDLNPKQIETLLLFAKGLPLSTMSKKLKICKSSVDSKLQRIKNKCPEEFNNAVSIRAAHKRCKLNLKNPINIEDVKHDQI